MALSDDLRMQWRTGGMVVRLLLINVGVFVALVLAYLFLLIPAHGEGGLARMLRDHYVVQWLRTTANPGELLYKPWTAVTYMFTHTDVGHIFWNMVLLWFGGRLFQDLLGGKRLLGHYLLGGLNGFVLFALVHGLSGSGASMLGASAAALSVLIGIAAYRPTMVVNLILIGPVKLMYVAGVFLLLDLVGIGSGDGVAHEAHIGGALYGFLASRQLLQGRDWSLGFVNGLEKLRDRLRPRRAPRMRTAHRSSTRPVSDERFNSEKRARQERIDLILDKISRSGYDSLSKEEKDLLFRAGKEG